MSKHEVPERQIIKQAATVLVGRTIVNVRYMNRDEAEAAMWQNRPLIIELNDGTLIHASCDEEGNDAGVLFVDSPQLNLTFGRLR